MLIKTILNKCHKFKSFVYRDVRLVKVENREAIEVKVYPRRNSKPICSGCHKRRPGYDRMQEIRRYEFIPLWGIKVFFLYQMRRVDCHKCGVKIEEVSWGIGKNQLTKTYMQYLAHWAKKLSWMEVAVSFRTSWEKVFNSVRYVVEWGIEHRVLSGITAIGIDEIQWHIGHKYLTLVYQINSGTIRLLWIGKRKHFFVFLNFWVRN